MQTIKLTADIASAYVANNRVPVDELPNLITSVHGALSGLGEPEPEARDAPGQLTKAQVRRSIRDDALVSFIDGKSYKVLKRHLRAQGMTPEQYRERFGLPADYPMTAPGYAALRSKWALDNGLGKKPKGS